MRVLNKYICISLKVNKVDHESIYFPHIPDKTELAPMLIVRVEKR